MLWRVASGRPAICSTAANLFKIPRARFAAASCPAVGTFAAIMTAKI